MALRVVKRKGSRTSGVSTFRGWEEEEGPAKERDRELLVRWEENREQATSQNSVEEPDV